MAISNPLILVINCGSSSIKFGVIDPPRQLTLLEGLVDKIGSADAMLHWRGASAPPAQALGQMDYHTALLTALQALPATYLANLSAVGHRVVHGGERFQQATLINAAVLSVIEQCSKLAPLHNPVNLAGIHTSRQLFPGLPQVAVFDTAFHQTLPDYAFRYPLPDFLYTEQAIRRYGFHGTSHQYVAEMAAQRLAKPLTECALLTAHLGNGCSIAAIRAGSSVDTSMGFTPLEGLMMGTRCGDIDPSLPLYLAQTLGYDLPQVEQLLNHASGLLGVSGLSSDMRELLTAADQGHTAAKLAIDMFCYRLAKYLASYIVPLGRIDGLVFTGGIGENAPLIRAKVLQWLTPLQFQLDNARNQQHGTAHTGLITEDHSCPAWVIATDEQLAIAQQTLPFIEE